MYGRLLAISVLFVFSFGVAQAAKCKVPKGIGGNYKLVTETYASSSPREVHLEVVISPGNFTSEYLREFRKRLKARYCDPEYIFAVVFESERAAKGFELSKPETHGRRAVYVFDRPLGTDTVTFKFAGSDGATIDLIRR